MKTTKTTTTASPAIYKFAEDCTSIAIRARHEKSGLKLLEQLQNEKGRDCAIRSAAEIATRETAHRASADAHTTAAAEHDSIANRITTPAEERTAAAKAASMHRAAAKRERTAADILTAELSRTYSDRADLVQSALLALVDLTAPAAPVLVPIPGGWAWRPGKRAAASAVIIAAADPKTRAALRSDIWRACTNAAGRAINQAASPDALNRTVTQATPATGAEVAAWIEKHGATGTAVKEPQTVKRCRASDCYDTMEYRNRKTAPGWYRVRHWVTVAPYTSIEQLNDNGDITGYFKSYNPFAETQGTAERLEALQTAAELTERERLFIAAFTSTTAAKHGAAARKQYHDTTTADTSTSKSRKAAAKAEYDAMIDYAFSAIGIKSEDTRRQFFKRLRERAASVRAIEQTCTTRAEYDERTAKYWTRIQANRTRGHATDKAPRPDCLAWLDTTSTSITTPVITWLTAAQAEEANADRAQAIRKAYEHSTIDNTTNAAQDAAHVAAMRYTLTQAAVNPAAIHALPPAEVVNIAAKLEKHRARVAQIARAKARAAARAAQAAELKAARAWAAQITKWSDRPAAVLDAMPGAWATRKAKPAAVAARVFLDTMTAAEVLNHYKAR